MLACSQLLRPHTTNIGALGHPTLPLVKEEENRGWCLLKGNDTEMHVVMSYPRIGTMWHGLSPHQRRGGSGRCGGARAL